MINIFDEVNETNKMVEPGELRCPHHHDRNQPVRMY